jgi:hypothetical protein
MFFPDMGDFKREPVGVSHRGLIVLLGVRKSVRTCIVEINASGTRRALLTFDKCRQPTGLDTPLDLLRGGSDWSRSPVVKLHSVRPSMRSHNSFDAKLFDATLDLSDKHGLLAGSQQMSDLHVCRCHGSPRLKRRVPHHTHMSF